MLEDSDNASPTDIEVCETFVGFFTIEKQNAEYVSKTILNLLKTLKLSLNNIRGQGYDGAANMSGIYSGVQARILKVVPNAIYVHCAAHNLNLILNDSVKNVLEIRNFFDFVSR